MKKLVTALIFAIIVGIAYPLYSQGIWKTYTKDDGLACNEVFCISQDKLGNMWFGTWGAGLSKLDTNGVWTRFFIGYYTVIMDIEIDSSNNVWVTISQRNGIEGVAKIEDSTITYYQPQGETGPNPTVLGQDSLGQIWCGTSQINTYWFDGIDWHPFWVPGTWDVWDGISDIKTDRHGKLYFGHANGVATMDEFLYNVGWVSNIVFDKQNRLWFGVDDWKCGLYMFDGDTLFRWTKDNGLISPLSDVCAVAIDSNNNVWIANGSYWGIPYGVSKFDGSVFTHFNIEDGLSDGFIYDIYVDKEGDIWFATYRGGSALHDTSTTGINIGIEQNTISTFSLYQNYPNPFNSETTIHYELQQDVNIQLSVFNLKGKEVKRLVSDNKQKGFYQIVWNGKDKLGKEVSSGIYIAVLESGDFRESIKLSLIR